jgi:hypothetical protein
MNIGSLILSGYIAEYVKLYDTSDPENARLWLDASRCVWNSETNVMFIDLTVDGFGGSDLSSLGDGHYELRFDCTAICDLVGNTLIDDDGMDDGSLTIDRSTASSNSDFLRLFGDSNGDGNVDKADLGEFIVAFVRGSYRSIFDADGDGLIDRYDLKAFMQNHAGRDAGTH